MNNIEKIKSKLHTKILGKELVYLQEISSTQDFVKIKLEEGAEERIGGNCRETNKGKGYKWACLVYRRR